MYEMSFLDFFSFIIYQNLVNKYQMKATSGKNILKKNTCVIYQKTMLIKLQRHELLF